MHDTVRSAIIGFVSGTIAAILVIGFEPAGAPGTREADPDSASQAGLLARIAALEEQLARLPGSADAPKHLPSVEAPAAPAQPDNEKTQGEQADVEDRMAQIVRRQREKLSTELRKSGWSDAEIESLEDLMDIASLEAEEEMFQQMRRSLERNPEASAIWGRSRFLRESLGEDKYEQYLRALGRPTQFRVNNVISGSAGDIAGLKNGDIIRRYGSDRVYNEHDLMMSAIRGEPGEAVTIEVERDGSVFYLSVPRGPLGTSQTVRAVLY